MASINDAPPPHSQAPAAPKSQRVLSCLGCQHRKVKCDRKFPCANCIKARTQCIPGSLAQKPRKRRFAERELLERLRRYESLLRQHGIAFETPHETDEDTSQFGKSDESPAANNERLETTASSPNSRQITKVEVQEVKNIWNLMFQDAQGSDEEPDLSEDTLHVREAAINHAEATAASSHGHLLFGFERDSIDLTATHPDAIQIFRLWQVYLDNVNPMLRLTHTPSLQGRIIQAASSLHEIPATLEALMFGIYCTAILSLAPDECQNMFGESKEVLSTRYQFGSQQALLKCGFLQSKDCECLTALYLYLISIRPFNPNNGLPSLIDVGSSISSLLGIAIRMACRIGIHLESNLTKCSIFEAELRRRLWWSLVLFDNRITEVCHSGIITLDPTWDCKLPLLVNDSDLWHDMQSPPQNRETGTDNLFLRLRSELGDLVRYCAFHLDFINPALNAVANGKKGGPLNEAEELKRLDQKFEEQYLRHCDSASPSHVMAMWTVRTQLAKYRLIEHHARSPASSPPCTEAELDLATLYALKMLEGDSMIASSPLCKGFLWFNRFYFPFPAYMHLAKDLKSRPTSRYARQAWEVMSRNFETWYSPVQIDVSLFFDVFTKLLLSAWDSCEQTWVEAGSQIVIPSIILAIQQSMAQAKLAKQHSVDQICHDLNTAYPTSTEMTTAANFDDQPILYNTIMRGSSAVPGPHPYFDMAGQLAMHAQPPLMDWSVYNNWATW